MADKHRRRPDDDSRDIYSSGSRESQSRPQRPTRQNPNHTNGSRQRPSGQANRPARNQNHPLPQNRNKHSQDNDNEELDRYNYVNRDVYSSSRKAKKNGGGDDLPPKKKKSKAKKIIIAIICIIVAIIVGLAVCIGVILSRVNYKPVDTSSYVEQPADAPTWNVISDNAITNILLIGVDRSEDGTARRSDTMMLLSIDSKTKNLRMVSFLRDLYVQVPTLPGKNKLNAAYAEGGAGLTMQTIENNFRINIDHYVEIDFENFTKLIDSMDGIDIEMTQDEVNYMTNWYYGEYGSPISLKAGMNHLDGKEALTFSRIRKLDSDFGRTGRQRQVMLAIFAKFKTLNPAQMTSVFYNYAKYITTDLSSGDILSLATQAPTILGYGVETAHVPEEGLYTEKNYNLIPDLPASCAKLREFLYGSDSAGSATSKKGTH